MKIGDKIPEILGTTADGTVLRASDFAGRKLVLYFYPKDNTPVSYTHLTLPTILLV